MALTRGTRIAHYEILSPLGAGGMGEVYRARDSRLHREVAIKVLPEAVASDGERLARLEREARTLASLNHPNIAQIHGLEGDAGTAPMLVMELVDGEDLATRIARGPIGDEDALAIGRQIAEGLDAAHSAGIIHRDLKPANVMVRGDGVAKILDFGLAKPGPPGAPGATVTSPAMTMQGAILGTAAYMSPEQARGRDVDKRSDIWAFGCVLFEMLTGRPAFEGETITDILGAIVKSEPDWTRLPPTTPPNVRRLIERCLQKEPPKRLRDIGDASHELDPASIARGRETTATTPPSATAARPSRTLMAGAVVAGLAAIGAAIAIALYAARRADTEPVLKFQIAVQEDGGSIRQPVISSDGRQVVYAGGTRGTLWVQSLDAWAPRELAGTESAVRPFWSPDGEWIGFFRSEALLKVPAAGGPVVRVATLPAVQAPLGANSGVWRRDGVLVLSLAVGRLLRVPSGGGEVTTFAEVPSGAVSLRYLSLLPDDSLLVVVSREGGATAIGVLDDDGLAIVLEASEIAHPRYAEPGYLVFARRAPNSGLWAVRFSADRHEALGEPFLIGTGEEPSVSRDGTLTFLPGIDNQTRELAWFSLDGRPGAQLAEPREWIEGVSISHDGKRMLASATDGVWAYDVGTGARSRITRGPNDIMPQWVDATRLVFVRTDGMHPSLVLKSLGPAGTERVLAESARFPRVTADGRRVVFNQRNPTATNHVWEVAWINLDAPTVIHKLPEVHMGARYATVSPDGSLVAYISGEVGRDEVFLTRLPSGDGKWQLSNDGGGWALFSPLGNEVFFRALDNSFMAVPIENGAELKIGAAKKLFDWGSNWLPFYDIARDGKRGVAAMPTGKSVRVARLSVVRNWHHEFPNR
jgi:hypothetical protein